MPNPPAGAEGFLCRSPPRPAGERPRRPPALEGAAIPEGRPDPCAQLDSARWCFTLLLAAFLGGLGYLLVNLFLHGGQWAMQPYNGHLNSENSTVTLGDITDRNGNLLATTQEGARIYSPDETVRRSLLHTVGDPYGYISTSVQSTMRGKLSGYNLITGLNDTFLTAWAAISP